MLVALGALAFLAVRVNGEAAEYASVLEAGKFRRGEAKSAEIKRCEEVATSSTTAATTPPDEATIPLLLNDGTEVEGHTTADVSVFGSERINSGLFEFEMPSSATTIKLVWEGSANVNLDLVVYSEPPTADEEPDYYEMQSAEIASAQAFGTQGPETLVLDPLKDAAEGTIVYVFVLYGGPHTGGVKFTLSAAPAIAL